MPGKGRFNPKQDRQIEHIKDSELARGLSVEEASHRAYGAVVNQQKRKKSRPKWHKKLKDASK